jgi:phosphohistidine phosphatase
MDIEMRTLCFVRHAKSSWDEPSLADIDRPLNSRGKRDAPAMAARLRELHVAPDLIVTSPARRALRTAKFFQKEFDLESTLFVEDLSLYDASPDDIIAVVQHLDNTKRTVFVFGHNPTLTFLANRFPGVRIDNVPTCGILQAKTVVPTWDKWTPEISTFIGFYYPKQYV